MCSEGGTSGRNLWTKQALIDSSQAKRCIGARKIHSFNNSSPHCKSHDYLVYRYIFFIYQPAIPENINIIYILYIYFLGPHPSRNSNRPFAQSGHLAWNKLHGNYVVGLSKQSKVGLDWYKFLCFGSRTT